MMTIKDGGHRLFEQDQVVGQPGCPCGFTSQLTRAGIKRRRDGQNDSLLPGRRIGKGRLPSGDQVFQVAL